MLPLPIPKAPRFKQVSLLIRVNGEAIILQASNSSQTSPLIRGSGEAILLLVFNSKQTNLLIRVHGEARCPSRVHSLAILEEHHLIITVIPGTDQALPHQVMAFLPITQHVVVVSRAPDSNMEAAQVPLSILEGAVGGGSLGALAAARDLTKVVEEAVISNTLGAPPHVTHSTSTNL